MALLSHQMNVCHLCGRIPPACVGVCVCFVPANVCADCVSKHPVKSNERMIACLLVSSGADLTDYTNCSLVHCMHARMHSHTHTHIIFSMIKSGCDV